MTITKYQIPQYDEMPSEEMIAWLNECPQLWDGDDGGITIHHGLASVTGSPGDWVVERNGTYTIIAASEISDAEENWKLFDEGQQS